MEVKNAGDDPDGADNQPDQGGDPERSQVPAREGPRSR